MMSSMIADVRSAAVSHGRLMELNAGHRIEDEDRKMDWSSLVGIVVRVMQVLVLVRMINLFFGLV
jgi:hypothetical protein